MKPIKIKLFFLLPFVFLGCREKFNLKVGTFPDEQPTNLLDLNTSYDEMNSDFVPDFFGAGETLIFSTNAPTKGANFDLDARAIGFSQSKDTGVFSFSINTVIGQNDVIRNQLFEMNSNCEERGPYSTDSFNGIVYRLFSRTCGTETKIFFNEFEKTGPFDYRSQNHPISILGEGSNEMYPSFYGLNYLKGADPVQNGKPEALVFTSDRDGQFDIYEAEIPLGQDPLQFLQSDTPKITRKLSINSPSNDHMPFVYGDLLVFASDRPGGYGGYDLYYSQKTANGWTDPVNFGSNINSASDEYRPIVSDHLDFSNRLMIFSSNRSGGMGGFDLYFIGIEKF
ncbi:hypothetical protein [Algoriphagus confluentis]|uniref:WD40-like Beta Propeller Repeat n=1 Tax=Algoriphagus confluentis TaxID=1697556 RepID=A0ABQ6PM16_9BACT|nr:hypothetical protein Aconfl_13240 [Algoriphagus confluentis]